MKFANFIQGFDKALIGQKVYEYRRPEFQTDIIYFSNVLRKFNPVFAILVYGGYMVVKDLFLSGLLGGTSSISLSFCSKHFISRFFF